VSPTADKLYYKIGEVAEIVGVKPYVLRYWETEFSGLRPSKSKSQHRLYRRKDVDTLLEIKRLLHDERFTIEGARKQLKVLSSKRSRATTEKPPHRPSNTTAGAPAADRTYRSMLVRLKKDIEALHKLLCA